MFSNKNLKSYYSRSEVAQIMSISLSSVDRGIQAGRLPFSRFVRVGRRLLLPKEALVELNSLGTVRVNSPLPLIVGDIGGENE
ncbi:hypothetical protein AGMMS50212_10290 [Spirochaetia bacterium]|nr:hypothetical protein AGMMS50212_10290 [Spirochaetia bacterium]